MSEPDYRALAKRLSDALLTVRPLGGSELFIRVGEEFFADPDYCKRAIELMRLDLQAAKSEVARLRKDEGYYGGPIFG